MRRMASVFPRARNFAPTAGEVFPCASDFESSGFGITRFKELIPVRVRNRPHLVAASTKAANYGTWRWYTFVELPVNGCVPVVSALFVLPVSDFTLTL
jgi:hypothetical protein